MEHHGRESKETPENESDGLERWPGRRGAAAGRVRGGGPGGGGGKVSNDKIVLAVLNDQSGVYAETSGTKTVEAVKMAVADFKAKYGDKAVSTNIEVLSADHQNKPEIANSKAQELYDRQHADVILDVPTSSAAFAVATIAKNKKKVFIDVGAASTEMEGKVQQVHLPLRLQQLHARPRHRRRGDRGRREGLVHHLPGLRVRGGHAEDLQRGDQG